MGSSRVVALAFLVGCTTPAVTTDVTVAPAPTESEDTTIASAAIRLEETADGTIAKQLSIACSDSSGTLENTWSRVFSLADAGVTTTFRVNRVNFAVQTAVGAQRVQVSLGTYAGAVGDEVLDPTKLDTLAMTTVQVPATQVGETLQANFAAVEIPAGANLVAQVHSAGRGTDSGLYFYLGATNSPETIPGYLQSPTCNAADPTMTSALGSSQTHLIIAVSGTP